MKLIVIDLDGTLVDSAPDLTVAVNVALGDLALPLADEALVRGWIGDGVDALLQRALGAMGGDVSSQFNRALDIFSEAYAKHPFERSRLYDGVPETLTTLCDRGFRLVCVSNKREIFAYAVLTLAHLLDFFEAVVGGDSLPYKKPDPRVLTGTARELGVPPSLSAMVGDSHQDLSAAQGAGFSFFWASYGYCRDPGPGHFERIDHFTELSDRLGQPDQY